MRQTQLLGFFFKHMVFNRLWDIGDLVHIQRIVFYCLCRETKFHTRRQTRRIWCFSVIDRTVALSICLWSASPESATRCANLPRSCPTISVRTTAT
jgi:hypothetical protein